MVILHCIPSMGGGGAERQLTYLTEGLKSLDFEVHVAYIYEGVNSARLKDSGVSLHKMDAFNNYDPRLLFQLVGIIRKIKADIVQTWMPQMDIIGSVAAHVTKTPHILSERTSPDSYLCGVRETIRVSSGKRASAIVTNSFDGARYWTRNGVSGDKVFTIRNALPFDDITVAPKGDKKRYGIKETDLVVLYAGRYAPEKNVRNLVAAFTLVLKNIDNCVVLMFGSGQEKSALMEIAENQKMTERLKVLDYSNGLWSVMKFADAFVSISHVEGVPNTVIEAMVCDCPVVLSRIPPHQELFDEGCACYADKDDPGDVAEKIIQTLKDAEGSRQKTGTAYKVLKGWTIEHTAGQYAELYEKIRR